jgi:hypothetical protein
MMQLVPEPALSEWRNYMQLIDPRDSFSKYKGLVGMVSGNAVPYLAVLLLDVHNIEAQRSKAAQGNHDAVQEVVDDFLSLLENAKFTAADNTNLRTYITNYPRLTDIQAYDLSKQLEPRVTTTTTTTTTETPVATNQSLASSPVFFWGVPLVTIAIAATTAFVLYKRKQQ